MALITESFLFNLLGILIALLAVAITFFKWRYNYWTRKGVPQMSPKIPFGNIGEALSQRKTLGEVGTDMYNWAKAKNLPHLGIYFLARPTYFPLDLEIVKDILTTNFSHFVNHGGFVNEEDDPLSGHLFNLEDTKWRNVRIKLTPTFTSGKMKMMFETMVKCSRELNTFVDSSANLPEGLDIKETVARFTTDIIGSVAFGIECNTLKNPDTPFRKYGRLTLENDLWQNLKLFATLVFPHNILKFFHFKATRSDVESFFMDLVKRTVQYRESNNVYRKDFLQLLMQLKNKGKISDEDNEAMDGEKLEVKLNINEVAAHSFVFFIAGFETSSTTMTFALYELAKHQQIQEKLRDEINRVLKKHNGEYTYEAFMEMKYMDQVINETLRKYPPVPVLTRACTKDYQIPGTSATIEKDTLCFISTMGIQHDPEYYPDPAKSPPDRFSEENKDSIPQYAWLPFGEGPRICIGLRFGVMQARVGLASIVRNHRVTLNKKTKEPLTFAKESFIISPEGGVWLDCQKL
uniref:Cytochrome P450 CYP6BQ21 n=1 Tax=Dastarcus helophoroides TaxID=1169899 RepID=M9TN84_9CUCU|nr:cytochrome P450 CYP6BQ21 [Dastarcus helophoroides]